MPTPNEVNAAYEVSKSLQLVGGAVEQMLNKIQPGLCFSLFVWTEGNANYIANCERAEVIEALEKLLAHWRAGHETPPAHLIN